jgi:hypothetical protein
MHHFIIISPSSAWGAGIHNGTLYWSNREFNSSPFLLASDTYHGIVYPSLYGLLETLLQSGDPALLVGKDNQLLYFKVAHTILHTFCTSVYDRTYCFQGVFTFLLCFCFVGGSRKPRTTFTATRWFCMMESRRW